MKTIPLREIAHDRSGDKGDTSNVGVIAYDESDLAWQLSAERGWMVPAYTLPPNAQDVKIMRALVKETMGRGQVDRLTQDIQDACATLDKKGGAHETERAQVKTGSGY